MKPEVMPTCREVGQEGLNQGKVLWAMCFKSGSDGQIGSVLGLSVSHHSGLWDNLEKFSLQFWPLKCSYSSSEVLQDITIPSLVGHPPSSTVSNINLTYESPKR